MGLSSACAEAGGAGGCPFSGWLFPWEKSHISCLMPAGQGEHKSLPQTNARGCLRALFCLAEVESPSRLQTLPFSISMVTGGRFWWLCCPRWHQNNEAGASAVPRCGGFASQSLWPRSLVPVRGNRTRSFPSAHGGQFILPPVG